MSHQSKRIILKSFPQGHPKESDFEINTIEIKEDEVKDGQVLVKLLYVSVDPYLRYRMKQVDNKAFQGYKLNEPLTSICLARVISSKHGSLKEGDNVTSWNLTWQEFSIVKGEELNKLPSNDLPLSYYLHSLGMTGFTAYFGLLSVGEPKEGETVLVSAAAGAVGMLVGQIAKLKGCKALGIAGGKEKVEFVKSLGFDDCLDYKTVDNMDEAIKKFCPNGIDVYFDNVGSETLDAVLLNINDGARLPLCGSISNYNDTKEAQGPRRTFNLISKNAKMEGFLVSKYGKDFGKAQQEITEWLKQGKIKEQIDERNGMEKIVPSFIDLFHGRNTGKVVVKIADE
ncbi:NADP-dependent oxidoreductase [Acrasis kona]|uniref:NADP-dependent oxidoreductase n=1 Tax=Acrasis kona TaxID=1008807 RepID=A0AAW2YTB1_9EUKA